MAKKIMDTKKATHEEWLEMRRHSIGGSDAGTINGVNPYSSLFKLYHEKKEGSSFEGNEATRLGQDLEAYVADRFCEEMGVKVRNDSYMYQDDEYDFITANIDRRIVGENAALECKTMSPQGWKGYIPAHYVAQCQHYMMVMGFDYMYIAVLVLQRGIHIERIERDDEYIENLRKNEVTFWTEYIEKDIEPEADGSDATRDLIAELYPEDNKQAIEDFRFDSLIEELQALKHQEKSIKGVIEELENKIKNILGDNSVGMGMEYECSWKSQSRTSLDSTRLKEELPDVYAKYSKTSSSRTLRTKRTKERK